MGSRVAPARHAAFLALEHVDKTEAFASEAIERFVDATDLSHSDKAFAATLVQGVVRMQSSLDFIINAYVTKPQKLKPSVRRALRIPMFELFYLEKEPHAAVDQGVELVGMIAPFAKNMANAVLRNASAETLDSFMRNHNLLCDSQSFTEGFSQELSTFIQEHGNVSSLSTFLHDSNCSAPLFFQVNALNTTDEIVLATLDEANIAIESINDVPGCFKLKSKQSCSYEAFQKLISEGKVIISDLAAQQVALATIQVCDAASFLEIGAGRGTKTALLQSFQKRLHGTQIPLYVCVDDKTSKRKVLLQKANQCKLAISAIEIADASNPDLFALNNMFTTVFLDAPCSGLGTLRRHPEIKNRFNPQTSEELSLLQLNMVKAASHKVNQNGYLVYATCTISDLENSHVVHAFLASKEGKDFKLVNSFQTVLTEHGSDAHFCAIMQKI